MQAAFGIRLNQNKRAVGLLNGNALCYGLPPQARVWRRNAMNTAGNSVPEREAQPAESALYRIIFRECARHQVQAAF